MLHGPCSQVHLINVCAQLRLSDVQMMQAQITFFVVESLLPTGLSECSGLQLPRLLLELHKKTVSSVEISRLCAPGFHSLQVIP